VGVTRAVEIDHMIEVVKDDKLFNSCTYDEWTKGIKGTQNANQDKTQTKLKMSASYCEWLGRWVDKCAGRQVGGRLHDDYHEG
jgi:hypothetical protein